MPQNLDFALYFNIAFFFLIGFGFLVGYVRGARKSLYALIVTVLFYGLFFLTIDMVINQLWVMPFGFALQYATPYVSELSGVQTIGEAVFVMVEKYLGGQLGDTIANETLIAFITGLSQFVLKLVYTLIYFTIFQLIFKFIAGIIRAIFFTPKKPKKIKGQKRPKVNRKPLWGALFGTAKGTISAFMSLIILGGFMSISESFLELLPTDTTGPVASNVNQATDELMNPQMLASPFALPAGLDEQVDELRNIVDAFNNNIFVTTASSIPMTSPEYSDAVPMHLYLFDSVLSFNFKSEKILLREELVSISEIAGVYLNSEYIETNDLSDITSEEVETAFIKIAQSKLISLTIPLAIEVGSEMFDTPIEIPVEELYDIDWSSELETLGAIAAVGFDLVNTAGILTDDVDLETVTLDGEDVSGLFDSLSDSELATLGAYVAVEPLLEQMGGTLQAVITVPEDLVWADEFTAFGAVAEEILNTGITVGDLTAGDPMLLITELSDVDFTILLNSEIVSHALKNVLSGDAGIEGLDIIVIPDGIVWFDVYDEDGNLVTAGELRNILAAVNAITVVADGFDFDNLSLDMISEFDDPTIDSIFESEILIATISDYLLTMDLGEMPLIIPDSVLDVNDYLDKAELKAVAKSAKVLVEDLACDEGDTACEEDTGFDISKAFTLADSSIDTLTNSKILAATIGDLIIDQGGELLVLPTTALETISVDEVDQDVVSKVEIKKLFQAVSVLGFTDLETMDFDISIINNLGTEADTTVLDSAKSAKLFGSKIVHATLSDMLFEQTSGEESPLNVPYFDQDEVAVRVNILADGVEYITTEELDAILQALLTLNLSSFDDVSTLNLQLIIDNSATLLDSAILHATISQQVFDLGTETITVPFVEEDDTTLVRITVGDFVSQTETEYIEKAEITSVLDALEVLGITEDIATFDGSVDLASVTAEEGNVGKLLESSILQATISKQLIDLDVDETIVVPYFEEDDSTPVRVTVGEVGEETEYIIATEIEAMIDALDILGALDVEGFSGTLDIADIIDPINRDIVLASSSIQATISKQLIDLDTDGTVSLPYYKEDGTTFVRFSVGSVVEETNTDYILRSEIDAMITAMDILEINDVTEFSGTVDLSVLATGTNAATVLESALIQATVSEQVLDLLTDPGMTATLVVPHFRDDASPVRKQVGSIPLATNTEYITATELEAMIKSLDLLEMLDVSEFTGTVDITKFYTQENRDVMLASAIMHSTISKQLIDLDDTALITPLTDIDSTDIQVTVGEIIDLTDTTYVTASEINAMFEALELLNITDVNTFSGDIPLTEFYIEENQVILLASASMHATISKQMLDLNTSGDLEIPDQDIDTAPVHATVSGTQFVVKDEIKAILEVMELLVITDVTTFDGAIDLTTFYEPTNQDTLLASASMHATISKQMFDLDTSGDLTIPDEDIDTNSVHTLVAGTDFVNKEEIKAILEVMELLVVDDVTTFDGAITLNQFYDPTNQDILLASASMHATISEQMLDLNTSGDLTIPQQDVDTTPVQASVAGTLYVTKVEIKAILEVMELLVITDVTTFDGAITLNQFYDPTNQDILLASASMHATISEQMFDLNTAGDLTIPLQDVDGIDVQATISGTTFIEKVEIKAMIGALDVLGITDVTSFTGSFSLALLGTEQNQDKLLLSASIHATIADTMLDLTDDVLIVPAYTQVGETLGNEIQLLVSGQTYVVKPEVKALINAFTEMGFNDFDSFGLELDSSEFFEDTAVLLASSSIQATLSSKMLNDTGGELVVPDVNINNAATIRINQTDVTYIDKDEMIAMIDALSELGLTDFSTMTFNPATIFAADFDTILLSASIQATISSNILPTASLETVPAGTGTLIIPSHFREDITIATVSDKHIEKAELKALLQSLDSLGITNFDGAMSANTITSMDDTQLNILLASGSVHTTVDNMLRGNTNIQIPDLAKVDLAYQTDITTVAEIKALIQATQTFGSADFTALTFDFTAIATLTPAEQDTVLTSMTVRNTINDEVETLCTINPFDIYSLVAADYESNDINTFLLKATILDIIAHYGL